MTSSQIQANETPPMSSQDIESLRDENGLIAGKFKTAADMVNSYKELEGKLGSIENTAEESTEQETPTEESNDNYDAAEVYGDGLASVLEEVGIDPQVISNTFTETGKITEDDYEKLGEAGFSKQVIDTYLDGLRGAANPAEDIKDAQLNDILSVTGGEEGYSKLREWTQANVPDETLKAFDKILDTQDPTMIKVAVQGFAAQMREAEGYEPQLINGRTAASNTNTFRTQAELTKAMADPRYGKDEAYTLSVYDRLKESKVVGNG
tara:strand:+ start:5328 stop:6122 length:795 start_codon:yes stop_codon:yes gene_type:complete